MSTYDSLRFLVLRSIGNFLLLFAIYGVIATFGPALWFETIFRLDQLRGVEYSIILPAPANSKNTISNAEGPGFASLISGSTQRVLIAPDPDFSIIIPKIGASSRVFANVDPSNESVFLPILLKGVAHAKGSVFPGYPGTTYLFAHSTDNWWDVGRYNAVFYLLKDLRQGDKIVVFFEGKRFNYVVQRTEITSPDDTSLLLNSHTSQEQLVLQTCWPPGTTWKRLFVIASPKSVSDK